MSGPNLDLYKWVSMSMSGPNLDLYKWVNVCEWFIDIETHLYKSKLGPLIDVDSFVQI
jgi:hypothetical protein